MVTISTTRTARLREFRDLVARHCPMLRELARNDRDERLPGSHLYFGRRGLFRSRYVKDGLSNVAFTVFRLGKDSPVPLPIAHMLQFRGETRPHLELFYSGEWSQDLVFCVFASEFAGAVKRLAEEYQQLCGEDTNVRVLLDY